VTVIRKHYKTVNFVVPDYAMSAGTIFCMSGDKIFMDYASALGPIDPQVIPNCRLPS
jgi:ClpP class serine protease